AAVSRLLPNTVHVSVRERDPAAVWQLSGALHLIDDKGAIIREVNAFEYADLPLIVGAGAPAAASEILVALHDEPELQRRASALIRVSDRRWNLKTKDGVDVKLPERGVGDAVTYLSRLHDRTGLLDEPLEYVDLRNPENFVYRTKGALEIDKPLGRIE
ncbi:MAG: cell division protein FtsQ/DivIB, partial [Pseudomonadota bacterium]